MKKGILIIGEENERELQMLEEELALRLKRRTYPVEGEYFWPMDKEQSVLSFRQKGHERRIAADWIVYLDKDMRKIILHLEKHVRITFYGQVEEALKQLGNHFCHCHKSYVVNMDKVIKIEEDNFLMTDGSLVPIGQRRLAAVKPLYEAFKDQKTIEKQRFFESFSCFEI